MRQHIHTGADAHARIHRTHVHAHTHTHTHTHARTHTHTHAGLLSTLMAGGGAKLLEAPPRALVHVAQGLVQLAPLMPALQKALGPQGLLHGHTGDDPLLGQPDAGVASTTAAATTAATVTAAGVGGGGIGALVKEFVEMGGSLMESSADAFDVSMYMYVYMCVYVYV